MSSNCESLSSFHPYSAWKKALIAFWSSKRAPRRRIQHVYMRHKVWHKLPNQAKVSSLSRSHTYSFKCAESIKIWQGESNKKHRSSRVRESTKKLGCCARESSRHSNRSSSSSHQQGWFDQAGGCRRPPRHSQVAGGSKVLVRSLARPPALAAALSQKWTCLQWNNGTIKMSTDAAGNAN